MKYVTLYESADDVREKAPLHIAEHRALWKAYREAGTLLLIGPFTDPSAGAMGVFTTREAAEAFIAADPFVRHGVVKSYRILEWMEAIG